MDDMIIFAVYLGSLDSTQNLLKFQPGNCGVCVCVCQVYEVVPCVSDCGQYVWVTEPWSVWKVSSVDLKSNCGEGVQTRKIRWDMIQVVSHTEDIVFKNLFLLYQIACDDIFSINVFAE